MPEHIHACETKDGLRYRVWSTIVDAYYTPPLVEEQTRSFLLWRTVDRALSDFHREIDGRLERARKQGTSEFDSYRSRERWEREAKSEPLSEKEIQNFNDMLAQQKSELQSLLDNWDEIVEKTS